MSLRIFQVDTFTDEPFVGNPAAVCILAVPCSNILMQKIAGELNLPETSFVRKIEDGYALQWFTPSTEVELCGHATLASAHILWEEGLLRSNEPISFHTKSGILLARRVADWIELDFPEDAPHPSDAPPALIEGLGVEPLYVGRNRTDYLVEVESEAVVLRVKPDFNLLRTLPVEGVNITSRASSTSYDFVSRCFAPYIGIDEDLVSGAAHCCIAPYWRNKLGKTEFIAYQASSRGGILHIRLDDGRAFIAGKAVTIMRSELLVALDLAE